MEINEAGIRLIMNHLKDIEDGLKTKILAHKKHAPKFTVINTAAGTKEVVELMPLNGLIVTLRECITPPNITIPLNTLDSEE